MALAGDLYGKMQEVMKGKGMQGLTSQTIECAIQIVNLDDIQNK
jgi:hypothetical protein